MDHMEARHLPIIASTDADASEPVEGMIETLVVRDGDHPTVLLTSYAIKRLHDRCLALGWL